MEELAHRGDAKWLPGLDHWRSAVAPSPTDNGGDVDGDSGDDSLDPPLSADDVEAIGSQWKMVALGGREESRLRRYLTQEGDGGWRRVLRSIASALVDDGSLYFSTLEALADLVLEEHPLSTDQLRRLLACSMEHMESLVAYQPAVGEAFPDVPPAGASAAGAVVPLLVRGLAARDAETVRRCMRGLVALANAQPQRASVHRSLVALLERDDDRLVGFALNVLDASGPISAEVAEAVRARREHPHAWCRALAGSAVGQEPCWSPEDTAGVVLAPTALKPELEPDSSGPGTLFRSTPLAVHSRYVKVLGGLTDRSAEYLDGALAAERARLEGTHAFEVVPQLQATGMLPDRTDDAAGRLAGKLLTQQASGRRSALLAAVAPADPWLATAPPRVDPPEDWVEIGAVTELEEEGGEREIRCLACVHMEEFTNLDGPDAAVAAETAAGALLPVRPAAYPWTARPGAMECHPPQVSVGPCTPLCFSTWLFTSLPRARFQLVPQWWLPLFDGLRFQARPRPALLAEKGAAVVVASCWEGQAELPFRGLRLHPPVRWTHGWHADRGWLEDRRNRVGVELVRFVRREVLAADGQGRVSFEWRRWDPRRPGVAATP